VLLAQKRISRPAINISRTKDMQRFQNSLIDYSLCAERVDSAIRTNSLDTIKQNYKICHFEISERQAEGSNYQLQYSYICKEERVSAKASSPVANSQQNQEFLQLRTTGVPKQIGKA